jgi:hypothetical protein
VSISCGDVEDFRAAAEDFRDDELVGDLDDALPAEFLVVIAVAVMVEAGEAEDGMGVLGFEGDGREEAVWEELAWRLDGMIGRKD